MLSWHSNANTFHIFWQKCAYFYELFKWALSNTHSGIDFSFCSLHTFLLKPLYEFYCDPVLATLNVYLSKLIIDLFFQINFYDIHYQQGEYSTVVIK